MKDRLDQIDISWMLIYKIFLNNHKIILQQNINKWLKICLIEIEWLFIFIRIKISYKIFYKPKSINLFKINNNKYKYSKQLMLINNLNNIYLISIKVIELLNLKFNNNKLYLQIVNTLKLIICL